MINRTLGSAIAALLLVGITGVTSCDEAPPEPVTLLTMDVKTSYPSASSDNWVIASDMSGAPIAAVPFESGETVELVAVPPKDGLINITLMIFTPAPNSSNNRDYYFFNSYKEVPVGDKWYLKLSGGLENLSAGTVAIHIANLPGNNSDLSISSFNRRNEATTTWAGPVMTVEVGLRKSPSDLFFSIIDATPKYLKIDAEAGQDLTYDYQLDFVPFDNLIPVTFSVNNIVTNIQGFNLPIVEMKATNVNYQTQSIYTGNSSGVKIGFNNGYSFYQTTWSATFPGGRRAAYFKLGDAPASASFDPHFELDFLVTNLRIGTFAMTCSPEFDYFTNEFFSADEISDHKPVTTWQVAAPASSMTAPLTRFPDEMTARYPYLESVIEIVAYQRSTFVYGIRDGSYHHYLDERFRSEDFKLFPKETFSLTK